MGQYYRQAYKIIGENEDLDVKYCDRKVKGCDYIMAKMMEHSYINNTLMDSFAYILYNWNIRLAWIGDYAESKEVNEITRGDASYYNCWGKEDKCDTVIEKHEFDYSHKFLVNRDKKEYISFDEYIGKSDSEWTINPISILTAIGNGRGGGDYDGTDMEYVGSWAWDVISIDNEEPKDMKKLDIFFKDRW